MSVVSLDGYVDVLGAPRKPGVFAREPSIRLPLFDAFQFHRRLDWSVALVFFFRQVRGAGWRIEKARDFVSVVSLEHVLHAGLYTHVLMPGVPGLNRSNDRVIETFFQICGFRRLERLSLHVPVANHI